MSQESTQERISRAKEPGEGRKTRMTQRAFRMKYNSSTARSEVTVPNTDLRQTKLTDRIPLVTGAGLPKFTITPVMVNFKIIAWTFSFEGKPSQPGLCSIYVHSRTASPGPLQELPCRLAESFLLLPPT